MNIEKIYKDPQIGTVIFRKRKGIRRMSIRVHPVKGVSVTVPYLVPYAAAMAFFKLKREWVLQTVARQQERYKEVSKADPQQIESMRHQAKKQLPPRLAELASVYGFIYNNVSNHPVFRNDLHPFFPLKSQKGAIMDIIALYDYILNRTRCQVFCARN